MQVVSLNQLGVTDLSGVFEEEIRCWRRRLYWDYRPSIELIRKYVSLKSLPGCVLTDKRGKAVGYSYFVTDLPVGYIGGLFVVSELATPDRYALLLEKTLENMKSQWNVSRIECQVFGFNFDFEPLFESHGFYVMHRRFLLRTLKEGDLDSPPPPPSEFRVKDWHRRYLISVAETIFESYQGSPDFCLCRDYQSREGCLRFLRNLVDNPGCGVFNPEASSVVLDSSHQIAGVLITSRTSTETGMIPQISVRRSHQGKGIGSFLLRRYFRKASLQGIRRITLSVSELNEGAHRLYLRLGFGLALRFHAFIWEKETVTGEASNRRGATPLERGVSPQQ